SGDIDGNDLVDERGVLTTTANLVGENAYHVLMADGVGETTILNGFLITAGAATGESYGQTIGGGMSSYNNSDPTLTNVTFAANSAGSGGGMYNDDHSNPTLTNVTFTANSADNGGGTYNDDHSSPTLTNVTFTANSAGDGGGMYNVDNSNPTLINVTFTANSASSGGGMYNNYHSSPTLTNVTFAANSASYDGGGMYSSWNSNLTIRNSIFWGHVGSVLYVASNEYANSGQVTISDSLVQGGCPGNVNVACVGAKLDADARFVRPPDSGDGYWSTLEDNDYGDLRLQTGSPAIDAGNNDWLPGYITTDSVGQPRIVGGAVDMGAHEALGLKIGKVVMPEIITPGAAITYTLHFQNHQDNESVIGIQLSDQIPPELLITDVQSEGITPTQIGNPPHYVWEIGELAPQENGIITLSGQVRPEIDAPVSFANTASVIAAQGDPVLDDNNVTVLSRVGKILYVDAGQSIGTNDGSSWTGAFTSLQSALDMARAGDQIWVAQGVYTPSQRTEDEDPRSATYRLVDGVAMYGGFAGTPGQEGDISLRDWQAYPTILSGDIDSNDLVNERGVLTTTADLVGENAYHVLMAKWVGETTTWDGFFITAGAATGEPDGQRTGGGMYLDASFPTLTNVIFAANSASKDGGGMYNDRSSPTLTNVIFTANSASEDGGGMYNRGSPTLTNVIFAANSAGDNGGGMYSGWNSSPTLINVTFAANSADYRGGGMYVYYENSPTIRNSIFWGHVGSVIYASGDGQVTISDSLVQGGCPGNATCDGAILDTDPRFVRPPDSGDGDWSTLEDNDYGYLRLQAGSPAVDAGNNDWLSNDILADSNGYPRIVGGIVDMGAHEAFGLMIGKVVTPAVVAPGAAISYSLHFHNYHDTGTVTGVQLSDLIPSEVLISEITSEGAAVTQIGAPPAYIWEIEDLEPQAGGIITLTG
ncbi:MAG: hypothetical protein GY759_13140, partial [Chloroflexi bacterium]|nr:hypothetical protein [Chloroflexota bacterium]